MDGTAAELLRNMEELSSMFANRMEEFERTIQQPGSSTSNPTMKALAAEFTTFKAFIWKSLGILKSQVELLALGMDRLETHSRRKILLLHGLKEENNEDVLKKILDILKCQMKMATVSPDTIEVCHRLGVKKDTTRPILIRFTSMRVRSDVWKSKVLLKGSKISMSEFLTKARQDLFLAARNHFGMKKCWSSDGNITVLLPDRTRMKIMSQKDLKQVMERHPKAYRQSDDK